MSLTCHTQPCSNHAGRAAQLDAQRLDRLHERRQGMLNEMRDAHIARGKHVADGRDVRLQRNKALAKQHERWMREVNKVSGGGGLRPNTLRCSIVGCRARAGDM